MATKQSPKKSTTERSKKTTAQAAVDARRAAASARESAAKARELTKGHAGGFFNFVREQGVIGLAVGLAIGTAAGASVKVIVEQLISPIVALLTRGVDLTSLKFVITAADASKNQAEVAIGYGLILSSLITLAATALVVYLVIHFAKLDRLDKKKEAK